MDAIRRFMQGRYGSDALTLFLMCVGIGLNLVAVFLPFFSFLALAIFVFAVWRMLSRNIYARQKETRPFCGGGIASRISFPASGPRQMPKRISTTNARSAGRKCACPEERAKF